MIIILLLTLSLSFSFAEDCGPEVDLNTKEPLKDMAVLDQDGVGLCYGFTAAQLIEYEMRLKGTKINVSPVDLSVKAGEGIFHDRSTLGGGWVADVMASAKSKGVVSSECMESAIKKAVQNNTMSSAQYVNFLELVYSKHEWYLFEDQEYYELKGALIDLKKVKSGDLGNRKEFLAKCDYQHAMEGLREMKSLGAGVTGILKKLLSECESREVYDFEYDESSRYFESDDDKMSKKVDELLGKNKPAAISFCSAAMKDPTKNFYQNDSEHCGNHALLVVGQRSNNGKCEILLRNSWGAQWSPPGATCACRTSDQTYYPDCKVLVKEVVDAIGTPQHPALVTKYQSRVDVGCWFSKTSIIQNTYKVGGVK